jgi:hypothetical protein
VAAGTPEQVARNQQSHTGKYLARVLNGGHNGANHSNHAAEKGNAAGASPALTAPRDLPTE